jgi:hypothetical protein
MERHPLFLNNLALLLIDEYRRSKNSSSLADAKKLLTEAVRLAEEGTRRGRPNFSWPADSLAKCQQLIEDQKRTYGKGADASR